MHQRREGIRSVHGVFSCLVWVDFFFLPLGRGKRFGIFFELMVCRKEQKKYAKKRKVDLEKLKKKKTMFFFYCRVSSIDASERIIYLSNKIWTNLSGSFLGC